MEIEDRVKLLEECQKALVEEIELQSTVMRDTGYVTRQELKDCLKVLSNLLVEICDKVK